MLNLTTKEYRYLATLFVIWRGVLFLVGYLANSLLSYKPSFPYAYELLPQYGLPQWLYSWANFDGVHYLTIIEKGYVGTGLIQAFFPLYPLVTRILTYIIPNDLVAGLLLSNLAWFGCLLLLFSLVKAQLNEKIAWKAVVLLLLFPTSFFGVAFYNESLFLLFVLLAFKAEQQKKYLWAGLAAGVAAATRVVGIFVTAGLLAKIIFKRVIKLDPQHIVITIWKNITTSHKIVALILIGCTGLLSYMAYLWYQFGDPLYFFHVQSEFGSGREEHIILLPQTLYRAVKIILTVPVNLRFITYAQELILSVVVLGTLLLGFWRRFNIPVSWTVFALFSTLLPTTTGTLSSMPRYVLVAFPFFVILAQLQIPKVGWYVLYGVSALLLLWNTVAFIQGYWVA